jgi:hypothetical protein
MRKQVIFGVAAAFAAMFGIRTSNAALILDLQGGAVVITDNGAGDTDPTAGRIINTTNVAGFGITITVAQSNSPGSGAAGILQIQSLDVQNLNPNPATLIIRASDTNYTAPGAASSPMLLGSAVGGTFTNAAIGDDVTFQSFADPANGQPAGPVSTPNLVFFKSTLASTESFSGSNSSPWIRGAGPYSLTDVATMSLSAGGQMNLSGTTTATAVVPEPASLGFFLGLGLLAARRRARA